ncbi:MAG: MFS transporter [Natrialbaceae archaeon]|nr:MFS transporter [Natrialbaceae archaeon]
MTTPVGMGYARIGAGIAAALAFAPAVALVGDVATGGDSGTKLSMLTMSLGIGMGISPIVAGYLIRYGYEVPFEVGTVLALIVFILGIVFLPETLDEDERRSILLPVGRFKQN